MSGWTWPWSKKSDAMSLNQLIERLEAAYQVVSGITITPETALESPTVHAVDQAIAGTISTLPVHVYQRTAKGDRVTKERVPNHPVERLLLRPSAIQDRVTYWLDATSWLVRYGNHYAVKGRGVTGPIRVLDSVPPCDVTVSQQSDRRLLYRFTQVGGGSREYEPWEIHHARGRATNGYLGDSPVMKVRESIALEIAAERFGASFFGNGAMPSLVFSYLEASAGHQTPAQRDKFIESFKSAYGGKGRFNSMILPKGMKLDPLIVDNEKSQYLLTRKHQRTVIAGALGVPPHLVGDLERVTLSNVEHQSLEFIQRVVLRYVRIFEASMERDLLTPDDRAHGVIIRFNLDGALRGDFKSRQEGQKIMREMGVINANDWRENENLNPRTDPGGDLYWDRGPSGQGRDLPDAGAEPDE